jgi:hypothetical protein
VATTKVSFSFESHWESIENSIRNFTKNCFLPWIDLCVMYCSDMHISWKSCVECRMVIWWWWRWRWDQFFINVLWMECICVWFDFFCRKPKRHRKELFHSRLWVRWVGEIWFNSHAQVKFTCKFECYSPVGAHTELFTRSSQLKCERNPVFYSCTWVQENRTAHQTAHLLTRISLRVT